MTGYVSVSNTAIDQDSPITVALITALRDNPIAITEGSSGAPKIQTAAINDAAVTNAKLGADCVTNSKIADGAIGIEHFPAPSAADTYKIKTGTLTNDYQAAWFTVVKAGAYRVTQTHSGVNYTLYVNSTYIGNSASHDITVAAGDIIKIGGGLWDPGDTIDYSIKCSQPFNFYLLEY